ncbi:calcium-binding protein [Marinilabilia sp.]|uniref:calcium-binding protein n=1 Tax=Marinilabilia sp. TaxID=2021252 RepID=UPI0025B85391|nr:calcium-binding protein [Marinilabilia sp.]
MNTKDIEQRIENIIEDKSLNVNSANLKRYLDFIKANIELPHRVTGIESDFTYTEYGNKTPDGDKVFEIVGYEENIEDFSNIFAKVKCTDSNKEIFALQLFEFKSLEASSKEGQILADYSYWIEEYL